MIYLSVKSNIKEFRKKLKWYEQEMMPFVVAMAITKTLQVIQKKIALRVRHVFKVTRKWWLPQQPTGFKIIGANKKDHPHQEGEVYSKAYFLPLQERGGIKTPFKGEHLLIPMSATPKYGRNARGAKKLLAKDTIVRNDNGSPIIKIGSGKKYVINRVKAKRGKNKGKTNDTFLYRAVHAAPIMPKLNFKATCMALAKRHFPRELLKAVDYARRNKR